MKAACHRCKELIDFKEDWCKIVDDYDWLYHWKCYLLARRDGHMPKPDYVHKKGVAK
jgi:hypothetical protein